LACLFGAACPQRRGWRAYAETVSLHHGGEPALDLERNSKREHELFA
jgi:hypothetical protein